MVQNIAQIEDSISELQRSNIRLQEQLKEDQNNVEYTLNDAVLRIIDILDMITTVESNLGLEGDTNAQIVIKKIEKRLAELLRRLRVEEITIKNGQLEANKIRVLETREVSTDVPAATIIEVCRKGYQRDGKTIRPADVITAGNNKVKVHNVDYVE